MSINNTVDVRRPAGASGAAWVAAAVILGLVVIAVLFYAGPAGTERPQVENNVTVEQPANSEQAPPAESPVIQAPQAGDNAPPAPSAVATPPKADAPTTAQ